MSEPTFASVDLDLVADGLALTITPDEPITGPLQVRLGGPALRAALGPIMAPAFEDVRIAEAERIAEELHVHRHDHRRGLTQAPDSWFAGMHAAARLACTGSHRGSLHGEAHRAAVARAVLAEPSPPPEAISAAVRRELQAAATRVAALSDRTGARPDGWNEAISEVSLALTEALAELADDAREG